MIYPFEVPSYIQGYRFSDESDVFYAPAGKMFHDLAGYGPSAALKITAGEPVFATVAGRRALKLDNTFHGRAPMPIPWMGSMVVVVKPEYVSGETVGRYLMLFGDSGAVSNNGSLLLMHFSGSRMLILSTGGSIVNCMRSRTDNNLVVFGAALDQETRRGYATVDGLDVATVDGPVSTASGTGITLGSSQWGMRFGDLDGDPANLTAMTELYAYMFEAHFFSDNIWTRWPTQAGALMASLRSKYIT